MELQITGNSPHLEHKEVVRKIPKFCYARQIVRMEIPNR